MLTPTEVNTIAAAPISIRHNQYPNNMIFMKKGSILKLNSADKASGLPDREKGNSKADISVIIYNLSHLP